MIVRRETEYRCDHCGRTATEGDMRSDRKPWWMLDDSGGHFEKHFCSPSCLAAWVSVLAASTYGESVERPGTAKEREG